MAATTLSGVRAKLRRADIHIDLLDKIITPLAEQATENIVIEEKMVSGVNFPWRCLVKVTALPEIGDEIRTMVGDALFNIRSSLDHLAQQLAHVAGVENAQKRRLGFPILCKPPGEKPKKGSLFALVKDPQIIEALTAVQPYTLLAEYDHELWDQALWVTNKLCNADKHRLLLVLANRLDYNELPSWQGSDEAVPRFTAEPIDVDALVGFIAFRRKPEIDPCPYVKLAVGIEEGPAGSWPRTTDVVSLLRGLRCCITDDINTFLPFFPGEERIAQAGP